MNRIFSLIFFLFTSLAAAQTISGVVNIYTPVISISCNQVDVSSSAGFQTADRVLIIQMQGASLDISNTSAFGSITAYADAGNFEFGTISAVSGNTIYLQNNLLRSYTPSTGRVQFIRVPQYVNPTVGAPLSCQPWNGTTGGVLVMEVSGTLTMMSDIDVTGKGFRGGTTCTNPDGGCGSGYTDYYYAVTSGFGSQKGEGLTPLQIGMDGGRGAWSCGGGGGNKHNTGGAGGGNYSRGGEGGMQASFCPSVPTGGVGGYALSYASMQRVFMGGGGGNSDNNNLVGTNGGNGGGIVIIKAATIDGNSHVIRSNGDDVGIIPNGIGDGAGGGGAGGSILLDAGNYSSSVMIEANGGDGGDQNTTYSSCFGPGGGGGVGLIWFSQATVPANTNPFTVPGDAGIDLYTNSPCYQQSYGATAGGLANGVLQNLVLPEGNQPGNLVDLGNDSTFCTGTLILDAGNPGAGYQWSTGATTQTITINSSGTYWVTVTFANSCSVTDTIHFTGNGLTIDLGADTVLCGGQLNLDASQPNAVYSWSTGETTPSIQVSSGGNYSVTVTINNCQGTDNILVSFVTVPPGANDTIRYPNVFTPGSDQANDLFIPLSPSVNQSHLLIFDRWGTLIVDKTDINPGWDGKDKNGANVSDGVYYWIVNWETGCVEKTAHTEKGFVSLFRGK